MKIGFIGLGNMGAPMAINLAKSQSTGIARSAQISLFFRKEQRKEFTSDPAVNNEP